MESRGEWRLLVLVLRLGVMLMFLLPGIGAAQLVLSGGNVGVGTITPNSRLTVEGTIESTSGGVKFPDGTVQITASGPTWHQILPADQRFVLVMNNEAVLDKETGLVWERSPNANPRNWDSAWIHCVQRTVDVRRGWRLPTVEELASLINPEGSNPSLPAGHPFENVQNYAYWSSTIYPYDGGLMAVWFDGGTISPYMKTVNTIYVWCVRGGQGSPSIP